MPSLVYQQQTDVQPATTPANAQGVRVDDSIGRGLQEIGQQGTRLASDMARIDYMQKEADGVAQLQKNISDGYRNFTDSMDQWKGDPDVVQQNGAGLTHKFVGTYDDWQNQLVEQQPTPRLKRMAAEQARTMGDHFFGQAHSWEVETNRAWRIGSVEESINTDAATIQSNPAMYDALKKDKTQAIDELQGLHPLDHMNLRNKVNTVYAEAAFLGHVQKAPQSAVNILTGTQPLAEGSVQKKIVDYANGKGVNPKYALAIAQFESKMDPNAQNGSSTGLFQLQPGTAKPYGVTDLKNIDENIKGGVGYIADNINAFKKSFRREPTLPELYSMHLLGTGGGKALANAPDSMPFDELAHQIYDSQGDGYADKVQIGNHLQNMTVGQVKQQLAQWMGDASSKTAAMADAPPPGEIPETKDMPAYMKDVSPQFRSSMLTHAQSLIRHDDAKESAGLNQALEDSEAAFNRGEIPQQVPTNADIIRIQGAGRGAITINRLQQAQTYGAAKGQLDTQDKATQDATIEQARVALGANEPGSFGYSTAILRYNSLRGAQQEILNHRAANPVGADRGSLRLTQPLDMSNPAFLQGPLNARYEQAATLSQKWNTPYKPLDDGQGGGIDEVGPLATFLQQGKPTDVANYLAAARVAAGSHPERYSALMAQVAAKNPMLATAGAVAPYDNEMAAKIIEGSTMVKDEKMLGAMPSNDAFKQQWFTDRGQAFGGMVDSSLMNLDAAKAAYVAMLPGNLRGSKSIDPTTWANVINRIAPVVQYNGFPTLAPAGMDHDEFYRNVAARYPAAMTAAGKNPAEWRMELMRLSPVPHNDGIYEVYSGTMQTGAVIDFNSPPDQPLPPPSFASPTDVPVTVKKKKYGEASFYRGK